MNNFKQKLMKFKSTYFLRFTLFLLGAVVLLLCIFALPQMWLTEPNIYPLANKATFLIMLGMYATVIPFYIGLWHVFKLLNYIDQNKTFSELAVNALKNIKICTSIVAAFYVAGIPLLYPIAEVEDAPGMILIGAAIACIPVAVAIFAATLQRLLQNAIDIKSENDLTV